MSTDRPAALSSGIQPDLQQVGLNHPKVRQLRSVERNSAPNPHRLFVAEGLWAAKLLLRHHVHIDAFFWCPEAVLSTEAPKLAVELARRADDAYQIGPKVIEKLSERDRPDGLLMMARLPQWRPEDLPIGPDALVAVADGMNIPGNLGTLIRTIDACGADALVLTNRRTRLTHPMVFRASQGMLLTVPIVDFDDDRDAVAWLKAEGFDVFLAGTEDAVGYRSVPYEGRRTAIVVGSERKGLSPAWESGGFRHIAIPMLGVADSLNVSIAASVLLYEARARKAGW